MNQNKIGFYLFIAAIIAVIGFYGFTGGVSEADASKTLSKDYTSVEYTGYNFNECGKGDLFHTGFKAKNIEGKTVKGTVCSGIFAGGYIRN